MSERGLTLMAVHAHPDDEVFGTGGVLAKAADEGISTVLVTGTRGEVGEIVDPELDPVEARDRLASIREAELRRSSEILGIRERYYLDYRDSGMAGTPENEDPRNFHNANPEEAAGRLTRIIRKARPNVIVTYDERGSYGHPDHIAAHRTTVAAFGAAADGERFPEHGPPWQAQKLYFTAFSRSAWRRFRTIIRELGLPELWEGGDADTEDFSMPDEVITTRVDVRDYIPQVRAAMRAHRSQIAPDDPLITLPDEVWSELWGIEGFIRAISLVPVPEVEDDLFAGF